MSPTVPPTSTMTTSGIAVAGDARDALLDLVGDVRDDLDRAAEVVAAALLGDHGLVDAAVVTLESWVRFSSMNRS